MKWRTWLGVILVIGAVTFVSNLLPDPPPPEERAGVSTTSAPQPQIDYAAIRGCKDAIRERLVAPSTAKFTDGPVWITSTSQRFEVSVDSQNGFGAMLRSEWECEYDKQAKSYTVSQR